MLCILTHNEALAGVFPGMSIAGQKLAKHDVDTGELLWSTDLASPIVAVLPPTADLQSQGADSRLQGQSAGPIVQRRPSRSATLNDQINEYVSCWAFTTELTSNLASPVSSHVRAGKHRLKVRKIG